MDKEVDDINYIEPFPVTRSYFGTLFSFLYMSSISITIVYNACHSEVDPHNVIQCLFFLLCNILSFTYINRRRSWRRGNMRVIMLCRALQFIIGICAAIECYLHTNDTTLFTELLATRTPDTSKIEQNGGPKTSLFFMVSFITCLYGVFTLVPANCVFAPFTLRYYEHDPDNHCI